MISRIINPPLKTAQEDIYNELRAAIEADGHTYLDTVTWPSGRERQDADAMSAKYDVAMKYGGTAWLMLEKAVIALRVARLKQAEAERKLARVKEAAS